MEQVSVKEALKSLKNYVDTYDQQSGYESYSTNTFVHDVLYGLGIAIDKDKYHSAQGYDKFKAYLNEFVVRNKWTSITEKLPPETCDTNPLILFCPNHRADKVLTGNYKEGEFTAFFQCEDFRMEWKEVFPSHWMEAPQEIATE